MHFSSLLSLAGAVSVQAAIQGFNYGSTFTDGSVKVEQDFENEFNRAKNLQGTSGFTSARLYTMIQGGTADTVISAIPAAISTNTGLLLGLWASAGQDSFNNELTALKNAINQYGASFTSLIQGISVGSEDLYRNSPTGIINKSGAGAQPDQLVSYIQQVRSTISGTTAAGKPVGHVDTWTAWVNGSNDAVINAVDWLGFDGYPYFQNTQSNGIENGAELFFESFNATVAAAAGKDVWVTETGWPVSGPTENLAVASIANAETYWQAVACRILGNINTFWYTLQDAYPTTPAPSFGIVPTDLNAAPLYDLTCNSGNAGSSSSSSSASASSTSSVTTSAASATTPSSIAALSTVSIATAPGVRTSATSVTSSAVAPSSTVSTVISSNVGASGAQTHTSYTTTLVTVTACSSSCPTSSATHPASTGSTPATARTSTAAAPSGSSCPANLDGAYEYPHLIVPVDSANTSKAYGTSYNGTISPSISTVFNFDIPAADAGKTCSLVFLLPEKAQLETSSYAFNGQGGLLIKGLSAPATEHTTYASLPAANGLTGSVPSVSPGNSYVVLSQSCPAGQRVGFEFASTGGLELNFFEDYNPSPLGVYITVC